MSQNLGHFLFFLHGFVCLFCYLTVYSFLIVLFKFFLSFMNFLLFFFHPSAVFVVVEDVLFYLFFFSQYFFTDNPENS